MKEETTRTLPSAGVQVFLDIFGPLAVIEGVFYRWDRKNQTWKKDKEKEKTCQR